MLCMGVDGFETGETKKKLERAVDGAPLQIPTLKFLTPPASRSPHRGMTLATE